MTLPPEWNEQSFVQIVFPHNKTDWNQYLEEALETFVNIAKTISKYQKCLIITKNLVQAKSFFSHLDNLIFVQLDTNDTWSRDFGAITVQNKNEFIALDFEFNAWGKKFPYNLDNKITQKLKNTSLLELYKHKSIPFVLEGGSIDSNGNGIILTTKCLLEKNRNPDLTQNEIEKKLLEYFGATKILWLNNGYLEGDDTDSHIDTLARFVSEDTIVYQSCEDENDIHYRELKKMENELLNFTQLNGNKFKIIALPWIQAKYYLNERLPATYANFLIINGAVLVPIYDDKNDKKALEIFKNIFPKRDIIGIDCQVLLRQHGSLHCVTMQYPKIQKEF